MNAKAGEHRQSEPCGLDVTISARYDWSETKTNNLFSSTSLESHKSLDIFLRLHPTFARLYNAAASPASRLRSADSLAIKVAEHSFQEPMPNSP